MVSWLLILTIEKFLSIKKVNSHAPYLCSLISQNCSFIRTSSVLKTVLSLWVYWIYLQPFYLIKGNLNCMAEMNLGIHSFLKPLRFKVTIWKCKMSFELSKIGFPNPFPLGIFEPKDLSGHQIQCPSWCWNSAVSPLLEHLSQQTTYS